MAKGSIPFVAFNRGILSKYGLARIDIKRTALAAEICTNFIPRVLGGMMLRPGLKFLIGTLSNAFSRSIPFIFSNTDFAQLECTDSVLRPLVSDAVITRTAVSTVFTNGTFTTNLTGWTVADETGATSTHEAGDYAGLLGTGFNSAILKQTLTVAGGDQNVEHGLRIIVIRGPVMLRVGSSDGADNYIRETSLGTGTHSIAFTPTGGSVFVRIFNQLSRRVLVDSLAIEGAGAVTLPTPWTASLLPLLRWAQSADVIFVACDGVQQRKIERRAIRSWSIVLYEPEDGPFRIQNLTRTTLTPSAQKGEITLTASKPLFASTHVGALWRITSTGQKVTLSANGANQFSDTIRVTGVGAARNFNISLTGTWVATVTLQRSVDEIGWTDVYSWTANAGPADYYDTLDNQIVFYRIGIKAGNYTSGTAVLTLDYPGGSRAGIVRITAFSSTTSVSATVINVLGQTTASDNWAEGTWSAYRGFPTAVSIDLSGRLWWAGRSKVFGSVPDAYESFDETIEGDSGPIQRSIGSGPVDTINWLLPLDQLIMGSGGSEITVRSTAFGEVISPTNFNMRESSTQGSTSVAPAKADKIGFFVQKSKTKVFDLEPDEVGYDYRSSDASIFVPDLLEPQVVMLAVQRQPDTRLHCVLNDGTVAVLIFNKLENVAAWILVETDGDVEDVIVLPGTTEDKVVYTVKRTVNSGTVRYHESWALETECRGATLNKQADSFLIYSGSPTTTLPAAHLTGEELVVWADGTDLSPTTLTVVSGLSVLTQTTYTVTGGNITVPTPVSSACYGLPYTADFKSSKLAYLDETGTALTQKKRVIQMGVIAADFHAKGLLYGQDFDRLQAMPRIERGATVDPDSIWSQYDAASIPLNGTWDTDSRLCLRAQAPRPVNLSAAVIKLDEHSKG